MFTKEELTVMANIVGVARSTYDNLEKFGLEVDEARLESRKILRRIQDEAKKLEAQKDEAPKEGQTS